MKIRLITRTFLVLLILSCCTKDAIMASEPTKTKSHSTYTDAKAVQLSPGVFDVRIVLSKSLEPRRKEFRYYFFEAQKHLLAFASKNGWADLMATPMVRQVEIYDTKDGWDQRLREFYGKEVPAVIPKTYSATIEHEILFSVSPEVYQANFPEGRKEPNAFVKLMTHELAHRLHVRICKGDENKMGPIWFFEGFAVYAADQLNFDKPALSDKEIWQIVDAKDRGSYMKYNVVFRHFLEGSSLSDYVKRAGEPEFIKTLKKSPRHS